MANPDSSLPVLGCLDGLVSAFRRAGEQDLYVRWSRGPGVDLRSGEQSRDGLTGIALPGLSANSLARQPWWRDRPLRLWLARRLHDYEHLRERGGPGVRAWLLRGREIARGPDNEPLVVDAQPLAWIADEVMLEARRLVRRETADWGSMDRSS
ncbi:DUF6098 family protein [Amycolatopsis benzoatilytica]|uniref:DUF6098 family protein n=1 Tax=Amycolatopsis benzoatilytica TaxID=346045 RepID=UPI0003800E64|nr:DUF6098 family protein [Amycolatopsis benzoatilytica]